jgi:hypothetical protein
LAKQEPRRAAVAALLKVIEKHRPILEAGLSERGSMSLLPRAQRHSIREILDAAARVRGTAAASKS